MAWWIENLYVKAENRESDTHKRTLFAFSHFINELILYSLLIDYLLEIEIGDK